MDKLLFIRYRKPESIDAGGEQQTNLNYHVLCQIFGEENVDVIYIHEKQSKKTLLLHAFSILLYFIKGYYYGLSPKRVRTIAKQGLAYSHVFIDRSIFGIIAKKLRDIHYQGKIITFFHNVESIYFEAKIGNKPWRPMVVNCVAKNDQQSCDYSDIIIALNERDQKEIEKRYHRKIDILSPIVFEDKYNQSKYPEGMTSAIPSCLFLGSYFPMNVKGILWFVQNVLPQVNIKLQIVGKGMKAILPMIEKNQQIEVFSDVADLKPFIENTDFMLLPIFEGSGMKVKTCEALMYGKNIIGTTEVFEGYDVDYNKVGALCNTKEEFIKVLTEVSKHPFPRFNQYARQIFVEKYSEEDRKRRYERGIK